MSMSSVTASASATTRGASSSTSNTTMPPRQPQPPPQPQPQPHQAAAAAAALAPAQAQAQTHPPPAAPRPSSSLQPTLPSAETQRHVGEARRAVVATLENMVDSSLQWRATTLHANADVLARQARDVQRATDGLRRDRERLEREARLAGGRLKELGNVQNWAEVLERDFLVLEETVRLARDADGASSRSGSCSCSCSDCGRESGDGRDGDAGDAGDAMDLDGVAERHGDEDRSRRRSMGPDAARANGSGPAPAVS